MAVSDYPVIDATCKSWLISIVKGFHEKFVHWVFEGRNLGWHCVWHTQTRCHGKFVYWGYGPRRCILLWRITNKSYIGFCRHRWKFQAVAGEHRLVVLLLVRKVNETKCRVNEYTVVSHKLYPIIDLVKFFITTKCSANLWSPISNLSAAVANGISNWPFATFMWKIGGPLSLKILVGACCSFLSNLVWAIALTRALESTRASNIRPFAKSKGTKHFFCVWELLWRTVAGAVQ